MLLYGHDLDGVIPVGGNAREHFVAEFHVRSYPFALLGHAYVALVDEQWLGVGAEPLHFPFICLGSPYLSRKHVCLLVLNHSGGIGGDAFALAAVPADYHLVQVAVVHVLGLHLEFPNTVGLGLEGILLHLLPFREVAYQGD